MKLQVKKLDPRAKLPTYGTALSAGADLYVCLEEAVVIEPGQTKLLPTGLSIAVPAGHAGLIFARSGLATKRDLAPANKVGVIDADYRGPLMVSLHNHGSKPQTIEPADATHTGLVAYTCSICGYQITEETPQLEQESPFSLNGSMAGKISRFLDAVTQSKVLLPLLIIAIVISARSMKKRKQ